MERINLKNDLKVDLKLEKIWSDRYKEKDEIIAPLYQIEVLEKEVTFLSINPSLPPTGRIDATKGYYPHPPYPIIDYNKDKKEIYPFFRKFYEIGEALNQPWTMLDLLYERESTQAELEIKYNPKNITEDDKNFLQNQIKLTFEILESIRPKVVVISNAGTDKLIHFNIKDLKIVQELPCEGNGFIYKLNGIPFISNESRFLGSPQHFNRSKKDGRLEKLVNEIKRVSNTK
ncbi:MAG TPA: hypothetical protein PLO52_10980 [Flavobacterium alvei]|nr:hypothetical protein [Flavobacterium alvei]HQF48232.1 hypothetical protein [Flavobacterium alvei]HQK40621.1 hypothetical protein [Flavobacterium alvei]